MLIEVLTSDATTENIDYFGNLFLNLHGDDFEFKNVEEFSNESLKILSFKEYERLSTNKLKNFFIFFNGLEATQPERNRISLLGKTTLECKGIFDLANDFGLYVSFVESFIEQMNLLKMQSKMLTKLNSSVHTILGQLQRVKSLHDQFVPVRNEEVRGVKINSRFSAGTSAGGEFFDFFKSAHNLWLFSMNADSYVTIGTFLSLIEQWKSQTSLELEYVKSSLDSTKVEFEGLGDISLLICKIDLSTYKVNMINFGGHILLNSESVIVDSNKNTFPINMVEYKELNYSLSRGEQLVILSPGYISNTNNEIDGKSVVNFIKSNWNVGSEIIQELTFQAKNKYKDIDFLPYDQTVFTIGVDKNVISKI